MITTTRRRPATIPRMIIKIVLSSESCDLDSATLYNKMNDMPHKVSSIQCSVAMYAELTFLQKILL